MMTRGMSGSHRLGLVPFKATVKLVHLARVIFLVRKTPFVLTGIPLPFPIMPVLSLVPAHHRSGQEVLYQTSKML